MQRCLLCVLTSQHFTPAPAGLFFCLASAEGAGLLFLPGGASATHKRLHRVLCCQCNYTAHAAKQRTGLYSGFSCDCTLSTSHDNRPTQAAIIPPAPRWRAYTRPDALNIYQTPPPRRTLHRPAQPPIIIRYIRWQTMPAAEGQLLPCADRWQVLRPAHLLRGQRLRLCRVSPAGS